MPEEKSWVKEKAPKIPLDELENCMVESITNHTSLVQQERDFNAILSAPRTVKVEFGTSLVAEQPLEQGKKFPR